MTWTGVSHLTHDRAKSAADLERVDGDTEPMTDVVDQLHQACLNTIENLMTTEPDADPESPAGKLLIELATAVERYEKERYVDVG